MKRYKHLELLLDLKTRQIEEIANLRDRLNDIAINKAENAILERHNQSNGKFELLKEQTIKFEATFATKTEVRAVNDSITSLLKANNDALTSLQKIVYIGLGIVIALQFITSLIKPILNGS